MRDITTSLNYRGNHLLNGPKLDIIKPSSVECRDIKPPYIDEERVISADEQKWD